MAGINTAAIVRSPDGFNLPNLTEDKTMAYFSVVGKNKSKNKRKQTAFLPQTLVRN